MKSEVILTKLRQNLPALKRKYPISALALFGSVARGEQTSKSDIDILVDISGPIGFGFIDLGDELSALLSAKVDLVSRRGLKPRALNAIEKDLILV
jgi:uncharacterized protein